MRASQEVGKAGTIDWKTGETLTRGDASAMAAQLLELGLHPRTVRLRLAERGIRWQYQITGNGARERLRRLAQQGLALCPVCQTAGYPLDSSVHLCPSCLERKWNQVQQLGPSALTEAATGSIFLP